MIPATASNFLDDVAFKLESLEIEPKLRKGENLFGGIILNDGTADEDHLSIFDDGYAIESVSSNFLLLKWRIRFVTDRKTRRKSIEDLREIISKMNLISGFEQKQFRVKSISIETSPEFALKLGNGNFQSQAILIFTVIPI